MSEKIVVQNEYTGKAVIIVTQIVIVVTRVDGGDTLVQFSSCSLRYARYGVWG